MVTLNTFAPRHGASRWRLPVLAEEVAKLEETVNHRYRGGNSIEPIQDVICDDCVVRGGKNRFKRASVRLFRYLPYLSLIHI